MELHYGKFNFCFAAVKVWNHLDESVKHLPLKTFKNKVKLNILQSSTCLFFFFFLIEGSTPSTNSSYTSVLKSHSGSWEDDI